ncbi:MAG: hypothetical protein SVW51_12230 [Pseudomonadota bacterium]|nr:hypothetical protein [Pseudomonadota bacterium]
MNREQLAPNQPLHVFDEAIFENIVDDLVTKGFSIQENGLPDFVTQALLDCQRSISEAEYRKAGIGCAENYQKAEKVRGTKFTGLPVPLRKALCGCLGVKPFNNI